MGQVRIGTSGFSYKEWKGLFYPADLPEREMLRYYASRFRTVEIDSTFYRMPSQKTLDSWRAVVPEEFLFSVKANQQITHRQRLKVPSDALSYWTTAVPSLGTNLGVVLYQLPPFFKCDLPKLQAFLEVLTGDAQSGFEFRHASWFIPEVYSLLERHSVVLCIHDTDDGCSPMQLTAGTTYVRLRRSGYTAEQREEWKKRWRGWAEAGIEVFAYIKHKDNPGAPQIALDFAEGF